MKKKTALLLALAMALPTVTYAYNAGYIDTTGSTALEAADYQGMSFEEFKKSFALPDDLPEWESENTAINNIPLYRYAPLIGFELNDYIEITGVTGDFDENTPIGVFDDMTTLGAIWGENYENACEYYSLTDVTKDTLFGSVREITETIDAKDNAQEFLVDVPPTHWARYYIRKLQKYGYMDGYNDGIFKPENTITRAETAKLITTLLGIDISNGSSDAPVFSDVKEDAWYTPYINAVSEYLPGKDGAFFPDKPITRDEFSTAVVKSLGYEPDSDTGYITDNFLDADSITSDNAGYITVALKLGIIDGYDDNTIGGSDSLTRAQAATILYRAYFTALEVPEYYNEVYATIGDYEITLGDIAFIFDKTISPDASDEELTEELNTLASQMVSAYKAYYVAELTDGAIDEDTQNFALSMRQNDAASHGGYSAYIEKLDSFGSDLDFIDSFCTAVITQFSLGEEYDEDDYDRILKGKVNVTVSDKPLTLFE